MKKNFIVYTFIIFVLTSLTIFAEREVDFEKLEYNEETKLVYVEGEKETFTGIAKYYSKDESSIFEFPYKNGKKEGRGKEYYLNGKFKSDAFFIDGLLKENQQVIMKMEIQSMKKTTKMVNQTVQLKIIMRMDN